MFSFELFSLVDFLTSATDITVFPICVYKFFFRTFDETCYIHALQIVAARCQDMTLFILLYCRLVAYQKQNALDRIVLCGYNTTWKRAALPLSDYC
jgi:hypothetical protein